MAQFFLSYSAKNRDKARQIEQGLRKRGHRSVWEVDELVAGRGWGEVMPKRLAEADALVALLTPEAVESQSVWGEIGAARALANTPRRTAILPVILGLDQAPPCAQDMLKLWSRTDVPFEGSECDRLVGEIDRAISAHRRAIEAEEKKHASPVIFVSHRHKDMEIAKALTSAFMAAFELTPFDIRCTSVQPYRLPFGKNTGERLRTEIAAAKAVLGILSPDTAESTYVMFELGAAWCRRVYTCPLLSKGAGYEHLPGPIFDLAPARLWSTPDGHQLLRDIEAELGLRRREGADGEVAEKITALAAAASAPQPS